MSLLPDFTGHYSSRMDDKEKAKEKRINEHKYYSSLSEDERVTLVEEILSYNILDEMWHRGYLPKLYNDCYGGFSLSRTLRFIQNTIERIASSEIDSEFITCKIIHYLTLKEHETGDVYGDIVFDFVCKECYDSIIVDEYDGLESLRFDRNIHFKTLVESIVNSNESSDIKVKKISELLTLKTPNPISRYDNVVNLEFNFTNLGPVVDFKKKKNDVEKEEENGENQKEEEELWIEVSSKKKKNAKDKKSKDSRDSRDSRKN